MLDTLDTGDQLGYLSAPWLRDKTTHELVLIGQVGENLVYPDIIDVEFLVQKIWVWCTAIPSGWQICGINGTRHIPTESMKFIARRGGNNVEPSGELMEVEVHVVHPGMCM
jgi:hypothetical protein